MKKQDGLSHIAMVIIIVILIVIGFLVYKYTIGKEGIIQEIVTEEENFSQNEILEEINKMVTEKYLEVYNANGGANLEANYNVDIIISYFEEKGLLSTTNPELTYDDNGYKVYEINVGVLNRDISKNQIASLESNISSNSNEKYALRRALITNEDGTIAVDKNMELCYKNDKDTTEWKAIGNITIDNPVDTSN